MDQPTLRQVADVLTTSVEKKYAWHRCTNEAYGLQLPWACRENLSVERILLCVTATSEVERYAQEKYYNLVVSHHPMLIDHPQVVLHTALDCCPGGINDLWAEVLDMDMSTAEHFDGTLGWRGSLKTPLLYHDLLAKVEGLICTPIIGIRDHDVDEIRHVVICSGLGGLVYDKANAWGNKNKACYITGELCYYKHGDFGGIIETGHTLSERIILPKLKDIIVKAFPDVQVDVAPIEMDYFGREVL